MLPDVALGAVIAATLTSLISLIGLIISKESKISDFRQNWIDELRKDLALVITNAHLLDGYKQLNLDGTENKDIFNDVKQYFHEINSASSRISLRLNSSENESNNLLNSIANLEAYLSKKLIDVDETAVNKLEKEIIMNSKIVLKKEWNRVKSGEKSYKLAKYLAVIICFVGMAFVLWA